MANQAVRTKWVIRLLPAGVRERLFALIALTLLPVMLLLGWIYHQRYEVRRSNAVETELEVARGAATTFMTFVDGTNRQNNAVGQGIVALTPYTQPKATRLLTLASSQYGSIVTLSWTSPKGKVLASSRSNMVGRNLSDRQPVSQMMAGEAMGVGDLLPRGMGMTTPIIVIATAVSDEKGSLRGIVLAAVEPSRLHDLAVSEDHPSGGMYAIFDRQGVLVYRSPEADMSWEQLVHWPQTDPLLKAALQTGQTQAGVKPLGKHGDEWISARVPIPEIGWVAGASRPASIVFESLISNLVRDSLIALLVFALAFLLAYLLSRTIGGPVRRLDRDAVNMGAGSIIIRNDPEAPIEMRHLRRTVEKMAADLINRAEALRQNEWFLEKAQEVGQVGSWISDPGQTGTLRWSKEVFRIFGISEEDFDGRVETFFNFVHPDDLESVLAASKASLAGDPGYDIDHRIIRPDGVVRWVHETAEVLRDDKGVALQMVGVVQDITERKKAEERERTLESEKLDFYRRLILAATSEKLVITERSDIEDIAGLSLAQWEVTTPLDTDHIRHEVAEIARKEGMEEERIEHLSVNVGEATTNAIKHAGKGRASLHRTSNALLFLVSDEGPGIAALSLPDVALTSGYSTAGTLGMGFKIMLKFADRVYLATSPEGTTVGIEMSLHKQSDSLFPSVSEF